MRRQRLIYAPTRRPREVQPAGTEPVAPRGKPESLADWVLRVVRRITPSMEAQMMATAWAEGHAAGRIDEWGLEKNPYRERPTR